MKISPRTHLHIRLQNLAFTLLFLAVAGLLGWLSTRYSAQFDWTAGGRMTLSEASRKVLDMLPGPVKVTAYAREEKALRSRITDHVAKFSRHKPDLTLQFVNPDTQPDKIRELGISVDGELMVDYRNRSERVPDATETNLANALQRLAHAREQHVVFLEGHGDRSPKGHANHDLGQFGDELGRKGINLGMINLAVTPDIPDNTDLLVIAGPNVNLLAGEVKLIQDYVSRGGNLLWLAEPGDLHGLAPLAQQLGVQFLPGLVVDASTQLFGIDDPTFALVAEYPPHAVTMGFDAMTLFPKAAAMTAEGESGDFERNVLLSTLRRSWTETGPVEGKIQFDADRGEHEGPLTIGYSLTRPIERPAPAAAEGQPKPEQKPKEQRIVVTGDGDFLANSFLGNGGNLELGLNVIHWLTENDQFINIPAKTARDRSLNLSDLAASLIGLGYLILLPVALIATGATIWFKRRRR
jgi:ABC-type uncharacterized transport system involved in gliding motility auxiliary subunit